MLADCYMRSVGLLKEQIGLVFEQNFQWIKQAKTASIPPRNITYMIPLP